MKDIVEAFGVIMVILIGGFLLIGGILMFYGAIYGSVIAGIYLAFKFIIGLFS